jgi:hypothetical protein
MDMLLTKVFEQVLERPAMYVGNTSIVRINAFMNGFSYAKLLAGEDVKDDLYRGFTEWVAKRFRIKSTHGWESIISFMAQSEATAYEMTKELWSEYKTQYQERAQSLKNARKMRRKEV